MPLLASTNTFPFHAASHAVAAAVHDCCVTILRFNFIHGLMADKVACT